MGLTLGCWLCYSIGQFLHAFAQLNAIKTAHKASWKGTLQAVWWRLATRIFIATMVLLILEQHPDALYSLLKSIGFEPSGTSLYMSAPIAGIYGYAFDNILTYIPFLKGQVPIVDGDDVPPAQPEPAKP